MFLYFILGIILLIFVFYKKSFTFWRDRGFPYVEPSIPMGNAGTIGFKEHMGVYLMRQYKNFKNKGPAFGMYMFFNPVLVVTDPELIKDVTTRNFEHFHERGLYVNDKADPLWTSLFTLSGQKWKNLRVKLTPTFTSGKMKSMFPILVEAADRMVEYLKKSNNDLEMKEIFASYGTEVITNVAFGLEIKCMGDPNHDFRQITKAIFEPTKWQNFKMFLIFSMPKVAKFFNMSVHPQHVIDFFMNTIRENMEYREKNGIVRNDFFQLLLNIKNSDSDFGLNEVAANSVIFFSAGFETSSGVQSFMSYELALNQDVQDRLRKEIEETIEKHNGELTYDGIMEMKYLHMVFNETVRRYPGVDTQIRRCAKDFTIPNTKMTIPTGTVIIIPSGCLHNDPDYFENPEKFDPERFNEENVKKIKPYTYIPFSEGPRNCIGSRFGIMQTKIGIVKVLRSYRIHPTSKTPIPMKYSPTSGFQSPLGGMWLKLEKLN